MKRKERKKKERFFLILAAQLSFVLFCATGRIRFFVSDLFQK
jgi:hypothetical protein